MSDDVTQAILRRLDKLERTAPRLRVGLVTAGAPLAIDLGSGGTPVAGVAHVGDDLSVADKAAVLAVAGDLLAIGAVRAGGLFVGQLAPSARSTAPAGWLTCAGQSLLRASYTALFAAIGTTYGSADGTHFTLPDLRGRVPVGLDNQGGTDAGRLSATNTLGGSGGEETHTLTIAEMPNHDHAVHGSYVTTGGSAYIAARFDGTDANVGGIEGTGGGGAHNNMPPYLLIQWLIYAGA